MAHAIRAAVYLRISDKKDSAQKIAAQRAQCLEYAARKGYEVDPALVFADEAISGLGHKARASFDALLDAVILNQVDVIVATEEERFARNITDKTELAQACADTATTWDTIRDGEVDPSTDTGEFFSILRAAVGRMSSRRDAARARASNAHKRAAGRPTPGRRVYGYEGDGMTPRAEEAEVVVRIFEAFLGGASIRSITKGLGQDGIRPTTGTAWSNRRIRDMLMNARYGGAITHKGEVIPSAYVEPIVTPEQVQEARALLADEKRRTTPGPGVRHLLSGIAECGVCGTTMFFMRSYRCRADTTHPSIIKAKLDAAVESEVVDALLVGGGALMALDQEAASIEPLTASLARYEAEERQVLADRSEGLLSPPVARSELLRLKAQREDVELQLDQARERSAIARLLLDLRLRLTPGERVDLDEAVRIKREIRERWTALDLDTRRTIIRALFTVTVHRGRSADRVVIDRYRTVT
ncbi:recombinase family protein [Agrococcus terreus]|uniref:recombinase family protein n=1 Tax=Agrococcus terreus TaxID=574649 RepID=UPI00384DC75A